MDKVNVEIDFLVACIAKLGLLTIKKNKKRGHIYGIHGSIWLLQAY